MTEFKVGNEKLYLSPVLDLYNGEIIAYERAQRPAFSMVGKMLQKALLRLESVNGQWCIRIRDGNIK